MAHTTHYSLHNFSVFIEIIWHPASLFLSEFLICHYHEVVFKFRILKLALCQMERFDITTFIGRFALGLLIFVSKCTSEKFSFSSSYRPSLSLVLTTVVVNVNKSYAAGTNGIAGRDGER